MSNREYSVCMLLRNSYMISVFSQNKKESRITGSRDYCNNRVLILIQSFV